MRPVIGITTRRRVIDSRVGRLEVETAEAPYLEAVLRAGGVPVALPPVPEAHVDGLLDRISGLVFSGGGDLDPSWYGGHRVASLYEIDEDRDRFEIALARHAAARSLPTLAICRGMQVINVALGGTLIEHLDDHGMPDTTQARQHTHLVALDRDSRTAGVVGTHRLAVNSIHHQAVRGPGHGLRAVGRSEDGVIEALEADDPAWNLSAVQWHPEYLAHDDSPSQALFDRLVSDATSAPSSGTPIA